MDGGTQAGWPGNGRGADGGPLVLAGMLTATVTAGPARADQAAFLNDLHNAGIHAVNGGDDALLQMGADLCQQLSWGASPQQLEGSRCSAPTPTRAPAASTAGRPRTW